MLKSRRFFNDRRHQTNFVFLLLDGTLTSRKRLPAIDDPSTKSIDRDWMNENYWTMGEEARAWDTHVIIIIIAVTHIYFTSLVDVAIDLRPFLSYSWFFIIIIRWLLYRVHLCRLFTFFFWLVWNKTSDETLPSYAHLNGLRGQKKSFRTSSARTSACARSANCSISTWRAPSVMAPYHVYSSQKEKKQQQPKKAGWARDSVKGRDSFFSITRLGLFERFFFSYL